MRQSKDPPAFIVLLENGAAMAGILVAAVGLALSQATGNPFFDGAASVVIGLILGVTALVLAIESKAPADRRGGRSGAGRVIRDSPADMEPAIVGVGHVLTVHSAPDQITVMMSADFDDDHAGRRGRADRRRVEEEARSAGGQRFGRSRANRLRTADRQARRLHSRRSGQPSTMAQSMHDVSDPRNASILINVNGELKPRGEAVVSVFDSGFMLGDGVWEGLRVHQGQARVPRPRISIGCSRAPRRSPWISG